ncbi:Adenosine kinase [Balamuthia mandrillaris]
MQSSAAALIVSGGSRGFGRAVAQQYVEQWPVPQKTLHVFLLGRDEAALKQSQQEVEQAAAGKEGHSLAISTIVVDFGNAETLPAALEAVFSKVDAGAYDAACFVNNHGSLGLGTVEQFGEQAKLGELRQAIDVNVTSALALTAAFVKHFAGKQLTVVNVSSLAALQPFPEWGLYCAGKAARDQFHAVLAKEKPEVRVLSYAPGVMDTDMQRIIREVSTHKEQKEYFTRLHNEGRVQSPVVPARKLVQVLAENSFESGAHLDFVNDLMKGVLLGVCNPLLDISAVVGKELLEKYGLSPSNAILAEEKHLPLYQELVSNYPVEYIAGGAGQNSVRAVQWMLRVPGASRYIGCIGKDKFGETLRAAAEKDGLDVHYLEDPDTPTGTCAVLVTNKDRSLVANLSAANCYKKDHLDNNFFLVEQAKYFYVTGFFLTVSPETLLAIGAHAAERNKPFMMNLSAPFLIDFFWDGKMEKLLPYADVVFGNEHEAAALGRKMGWGENLKDVAAKLAEMPKVNTARPRTVVFTQGAEPTLVFHNGELLELAVPPVPTEEIVDTNGAGDCFVGGFLSRYIQGRPLTECVEAGNYCAGVCIRTAGIKFEGTPTFRP